MPLANCCVYAHSDFFTSKLLESALEGVVGFQTGAWQVGRAGGGVGRAVPGLLGENMGGSLFNGGGGVGKASNDVCCCVF